MTPSSREKTTQDRIRRNTGEAHPVDVYVGTRIKQRRIEQGMSQEKLSSALNVTFQQVQKYERGANRVGASRLYELSQALDVPVGYFFEGMPEAVSLADSALHAQGQDADFRQGSVLSRSETLRLVTNYYRISSDKQRRAIYAMVKALAEAEVWSAPPGTAQGA